MLYYYINNARIQVKVNYRLIAITLIQPSARRLECQLRMQLKNRAATLQKRRESHLREKAWKQRKDQFVAKTRGKALRLVCANAIHKMRKHR